MFTFSHFHFLQLILLVYTPITDQDRTALTLPIKTNDFQTFEINPKQWQTRCNICFYTFGTQVCEHLLVSRPLQLNKAVFKGGMLKVLNFISTLEHGLQSLGKLLSVPSWVEGVRSYSQRVAPYKVNIKCGHLTRFYERVPE